MTVTENENSQNSSLQNQGIQCDKTGLISDSQVSCYMSFFFPWSY